ncbi:hypothetical protein DICPUDRAFT_29786 [Dictyostelium purpureum]|uniref:U3 small nucleolar RNA-associated protein 15 C-terminal domain-containing protein n=1 Tax=Dictyostelium purpureum TaxID=5786 RepID=F0ZE66_DICPU|nr:uncharacterized protein DICPUDRAFT_29786 [Dictyostelium purpureum]EGC37771.1 hypothetical protein DICPUDRAFT_29786 [Dictyostelium purpureum]|eukprot:XP_003285710.1 hypothetical protein DICPUDRAFT_29786 [Dictyostelium purpureum]
MMNDYTFLHNLPDVPVPFINPVITGDAWKLKELSHKKYDSMISRIELNPVNSSEIVATFNNKVRFLSTNSKKPDEREITSFKDTPYGASYRDDGKLIVVGGEDPVVKLIDVSSRNILRKFEGHTGAIHCTRFVEKGTLISSSNDGSIRTWDIQTGDQLQIVGNHQDKVRALAKHPTNFENIWMSGSYDHTVKVWDIRSGGNKATMSFNHGAPVEDLLMLQGGTIAISVGSNYFKVWDLVSSKEVYQGIHAVKSMTSIHLSNSKDRFLTAGLDHTVRVFSTQSYSLINSIEFSEPLLSLTLVDDRKVIAGSAKGSLYYARKTNPVSVSKSKKTSESSIFNKHKNGKPQLNNQIITNDSLGIYKSSHLDRLLRKFEHKSAFDTAIFINKNIDFVFKVVCELSRRDALDIVLKERETTELDSILQMINKLINTMKYQQCGVLLLEKIVDFYHPSVFQENKQISTTMSSIKVNLVKEQKKQAQLLELSGALELLYSSSISQSTPSTPSKRKLEDDE